MKNKIAKLIITGLATSLLFGSTLAAHAEAPLELNNQKIKETVNSIKLNKNIFESALIIVSKDKIEQVSVKDESISIEAILKERGLFLSDFTDEKESIIPQTKTFEDKEVFVIYNKSIEGNSEFVTLPFSVKEEIDPVYFTGEKFEKTIGEVGSALKTTITSTQRDSEDKDSAFSESSQMHFNVLTKPVDGLIKIGNRDCDTTYSCDLVSGEKDRLKTELGHPLGENHTWTTYESDPSHSAGAADFPVASGTPIYAITDGVVKESGWMGAGGNQVTILHSDGNSSTYAHMVESPPVKIGDQVSKGELIGNVGSTGNSTGPHLHFEIRDQTYLYGKWISVASYYDAYKVSIGACTEGPCAMGR